MRILLLVALFVAHSILTNAQTITYVGNMGVLISGDSTSILIDGLHKEYKPAYQYPPKSLVDELIGTEKAYQPPIRYILNTHIHKDHFDAELIVEFMQHNAEAVLFGTAQMAEELKQAGFPGESTSGIQTITTDDYSRQTFPFDDLTITAFFIDHVNPARHSATKNVGYLIEMAEQKILHLGDADLNAAIFEKLGLQQDKINVAIIPDWLAMSKTGVQIIREYIQPEKLIITHISPTWAEDSKMAVRQFFPEAVFFTEIKTIFTF